MNRCVIRESLSHTLSATSVLRSPHQAGRLLIPLFHPKLHNGRESGEGGAMAADDEYDDDFEEIIADEDEDDFAPPSAAKAAAAAPVDDMLSDFDAVRVAGLLLRR